MMHGREKSDPAIVARKPTNKADRSAAERSRWSEGRGPRGMRTGKARTGRRAGRACHRRWNACGKHLPFGPEVGAVCGKAARTDLCGGRSCNERPYRYGAGEPQNRLPEFIPAFHIAKFRISRGHFCP